jgi:hypothetical protein
MKFNHVGIPTVSSFDGEIPLPHLKVTVSDYLDHLLKVKHESGRDPAAAQT